MISHSRPTLGWSAKAKAKDSRLMYSNYLGGVKVDATRAELSSRV